MLILGLMDVPWWLTVLAAVIVYLIYACQDYNYFKNQGIPGPTPVPLVGTMYRLFQGPLAYKEMKHVKKYGEIGVHGEFFGSRPTLVVYDEEILCEVLVKEFPTFPNRMVLDSTSITSKMLLNLKGAHWKHIRNEMTPTFTTGKLKMMNHEINRCANTLADSLAQSAKEHGEVTVKDYAGGYTMDVIASTAFGIRVDSQKDRNNPFVANARKIFETDNRKIVFLLHVMFPTLANLLTKLGLSTSMFPKETMEFFSNITKQAVEMRKDEKDENRTDFLQLMINASEEEKANIEADTKTNQEKSSVPGITMEEILANALVFFAAGYETTATTLAFFLYNMARYPDVQDKIMEEINTVIGEKQFVETTDIQEMAYLDQCLNESLRLYPPVLRVNRLAERDITIKNIFIRKGILITVPIFAIHMDPRKWPEPEKFDPERFSVENKKKRSPYHFIPFGYGPRHCIGMRLALQEVKVAIIHVLKKLKVSACDGTQNPLVFKNSGVFMNPEKPLVLKLEPRIIS